MFVQENTSVVRVDRRGSVIHFIWKGCAPFHNITFVKQPFMVNVIVEPETTLQRNKVLELIGSNQGYYWFHAHSKFIFFINCTINEMIGVAAFFERAGFVIEVVFSQVIMAVNPWVKLQSSAKALMMFVQVNTSATCVHWWHSVIGRNKICAVFVNFTLEN